MQNPPHASQLLGLPPFTSDSFISFKARKLKIRMHTAFTLAKNASEIFLKFSLGTEIRRFFRGWSEKISIKAHCLQCVKPILEKPSYLSRQTKFQKSVQLTFVAMV